MKEQIEEMRNEQIGEMAVIIYVGDRFGLPSVDIAERLYNAGYRKQSDVIDEFVKRLLDAFPECNRDARCPAIYYDDYRYIIEELAEEMKGGEE